MNGLINSYLARVEAKLQVDEASKRQILKELRAHLKDRVDEERAARPDAPEEEVVQEVLNDFGSPDDLALAYTPQGTTLRDKAGRTLVTLPVVVKGVGRAVKTGGTAAAKGAAAVGRGILAFASRVVVPVLIAVLVLAAIGLVVGFFLFDDITALVAAHTPEEIYQESVRCTDTACDRVFTGQFHVAADRFDRLVLDAYIDRGNPDQAGAGTAQILILAPDGTELLNRTAGPGDPARVWLDATWSPQEGPYTVQYEFTGFHGRVHLHVDGFAAAS